MVSPGQFLGRAACVLVGVAVGGVARLSTRRE